MRCKCDHVPGAVKAFRPIKRPWAAEVAGLMFHSVINALACSTCGTRYVEDCALAAFDRRVCLQLLKVPPHGDIARFIRRSIGIPTKDIAAGFEVTTETVAAWERAGPSVAVHYWQFIAEAFAAEDSTGRNADDDV